MILRAWQLRLLLVVLPVAVGRLASAQVQVADIHQGPGDDSAFPADFIPFGRQLAFTARTEAQGRELWLSDGTAAGTYLLNDLFPGRFSALGEGRLPDGRSVPFTRQAAAAGGRLYFVANDGLYGPQLWSTDGSPAATFRRSSFPFKPLIYGLTAVGERLYFFTFRPAEGWQLWYLEERAAEPLLVRGNLGDEAPGDMQAAGGILYFSTALGSDVQLWRSDGTEAGTQIVADRLYPPGAPGLDRLSQVCARGSQLFFAARRLGADPDPNAVGLWATEGNFESTRLLAKVFTVSLDAYPEGPDPVVVGDSVYFLLYSIGEPGLSLWVSDGRSVGTRRIFATDSPQAPFRESNLVFQSGRLWFNGPAAEGGTAIWSYALNDRTVKIGSTIAPPESERLFASFSEGASAYFADRQGHLVLLSKAITQEVDFWRLDPLNGLAIPDTTVAPYLTDLRQAMVLDTFLLFSAVDSLGVELFRSSQNSSPGRLLNLAGNTDAFFGFETLQVVGERLLFPAYQEGTGLELWAVENDSARLLKELWPGERSGMSFTSAVLNGQMLFRGQEELGGAELWISDGSPAGTRLLADLLPGSGSGFPQFFVLLKDRLYFIAQGADGRQTLWFSNGTAVGTQAVFPFGADEFGIPVRVRNMEAAGDRLLIVTRISGSDLVWFSDGSARGTRPMGQVFQSVGPSATVGTITYFPAQARDSALRQLWRSDGTTEGTRRVGPMTAADPAHLIAFRGRLFFTADDGTRGRELWVSDPADEGATLVRDIFPGPFDGITEPHFAVWQDRLYFQGGSAIGGRELWSTDGTAGGVRQELDLVAGGQGAFPNRLGVQGKRLIFNAYTPENGMEWWALEPGRAARQLADIHVGPGSSNPFGPVQVGEKLYFIADDGRSGKELWQLSLPPVVVSRRPEPAKEVELQVFPNPAGDHFQLVSSKSLQGPLRLMLFDILGRLCLQQDLPEGLPAEMVLRVESHNLRSGLYRLVLRGPGQERQLSILRQ